MAKMGNRWMWILVFFDLPVSTKPERRAATQFRNNLLKDGYIMLQWSVYARPCNGLERVNKHTSRLKVMVPKAGSVRVMVVTEQQFERTQILIGKRRDEEEIGCQQLVLF
jgi:CRISPR-associated protein Cas2